MTTTTAVKTNATRAGGTNTTNFTGNDTRVVKGEINFEVVLTPDMASASLLVKDEQFLRAITASTKASVLAQVEGLQTKVTTKIEVVRRLREAASVW